MEPKPRFQIEVTLTAVYEAESSVAAQSDAVRSSIDALTAQGFRVVVSKPRRQLKATGPSGPSLALSEASVEAVGRAIVTQLQELEERLEDTDSLDSELEAEIRQDIQNLETAQKELAHE